MILKEFDLDIPYVVDKDFVEQIMNDQGLEYFEATRKDYELHWKQKRILFRDQVRCVAAHFERLFQKYKFKTSRSWKVSIDCYDELDEETKLIIPSEVYSVKVLFNINQFLSADNIEKKKLVFNALVEGLNKIIEFEEWNREPFNQVIEEMKKTNLINTYTLYQPKFNPKRNLKAELYCEHDVDSFEATIIIRDKNNVELERKKVLSEKPNEWYFVKHLGNFYWKNNSEIVLSNKNKTEEITFRL